MSSLVIRCPKIAAWRGAHSPPRHTHKKLFLAPGHVKASTFAAATAAATVPLGDAGDRHEATHLSALWHMARPINLLPSYLLVLLGAWAAGGRSLLALGHFTVWLMGAVSAAIAMASCVLNDYFDFAAGVDSLNAPTKPLPSGAVPSELALLAGSAAYVTVLLTACFLPDPRMRTVIASSAAVTLLYTPVLKRISFLKNAAVAATIAAAPLAGALAAGAVGRQLHIVAVPCAFLFLAVCYREILMDINDVEGDAANGVKTLPVLLGRHGALGMGVSLLIGCLALVIATAAHGTGLAWVYGGGPAAWEACVRGLGAAVGCAAVARPMVAAVHLWRSGFPSSGVSMAIDETLKTVGLGMILLTAMA